MTDSNWVLVDDRDPGIAYGPYNSTTIWHGGVSQEYMQTTTGLDPGDTASYYFNASSIAVFGTYGPAGGAGPVVAIYQVDNTPATTVTGPISQATLYRQNFWTSDSQLPSLAPGAFHQLVVTTTVSTLWVDYVAYPPDLIASASSTSTLPSSTFTTNLTPTTLLTTSTSTTGPSTDIEPVIAGIVIGTVTFVLAIIALVIFMWRRRRSRSTSREFLVRGEVFASAAMSQSSPASTVVGTPLPRPFEDAPHSSIPQEEHELQRPPLQALTRTFDGGVSLMGGPLDIPPEYQEHYQEHY